jgi:hypothetical protein
LGDDTETHTSKCDKCEGLNGPAGGQEQGGSPITFGWRTDAPTGSDTAAKGKENLRLWMIAALLVYLWLLGLVSSYMMGGFIHLLVTLAVVIVLVKIIQGRRLV